MSNANILYTQPILNKDYSLEDYSIVVNLQVELVNKNNLTINSEKETIAYEYVFNGTSDYKSFLEGQSMTFQHGNGALTKKRYLSTNGYDYSKIDDLSTIDGSVECFGIKTIDISYNNYMIPEVTIEFIDIRGISLFIPEELRHVKRVDGIDYSADDNITGSFFKAFFTMPYPKFKLMIKGFYGQALSYTLFCADFRARFDCTTGNFAATARFVGYTLSLLNDITLNTLLVAPYSEYYGIDYWNNKIQNDFMIDGKPMPTLVEIIENYNKLKENFNTTNINNPIFNEIQTINYDINNLGVLINSFKLYYNTLISYFSKKNISQDFNFKYIQNDYTFILLTKGDNKQVDVSDDINIKYNYNNLKEAFGLYNKLETQINKDWPQELITLITIDDSIKAQFKNGIFKNYGLSFNGEYDNIYIFNGNDFYKLLESNNKLLTENLAKKNEMLSLQNQKDVLNALGFRPTVKNITYIILAHLETLIYIVYRCSDEVNKLKRTQTSLNLTSSDINFEMIDNFVKIFPKVELIRSKNNNLRVLEEGWIGDLNNGLAQPEAMLINSLLDGVNDVTKKIEVLSSDNTNIDNVLFPIMTLDLFNKSNYFINNINFNNLSEFIGAVGIRFAQLNYFYGNYMSPSLGEIDAENFFIQYPSPSTFFLKRLNDNDIAEYKFFINCLIDSSEVENEKIDKQWCWESINNSLYCYSGGDYFYNLDTNILPYKNLSWEDIKNEMTKKTYSDINNYILINEDKNYVNENVILIDKSYEKYIGLQTLTEKNVNNEKVKTAFNTNFDFNKFLSDYFINKKIMKKFSSLYNIINFSQSTTNNLLPETKTLYINSFTKKVKYDDDFSFIYTYQSENEDILYKRTYIKNEDIKTLSEIEIFTIPTFNGIIDDSLNEKISLFGQPIYYAQKNNYIKALLFLITLVETYINIDDIISNINSENSNNSILYLPYISILYIGGIFYAKKNKNLLVSRENDLEIESYIDSVYSNNMPRKEVCDAFENEFKKWVDDTYGFKYLQTYLEIHNENFTVISLEQLDSLINNLSEMDSNDYIEYLIKKLHENFFKTYITFKIYEHNDYKYLKLYHRETSVINNMLVKLLYQPCFICKYSTNLKNRGTNTKKPKDASALKIYYTNASYYYPRFIKRLKELYNVQSYSDVVEYNNTNITNNIKDDIKITYYKYLKIVWDRWLDNNDEHNWYLSNFSKHWYFIDAFYNKVGEDILINIENLANIIFYSQNQESYSLLSFLSTLYSKDKLMFQSVQNFLDIVDNKKGYDNMMKMFKAIPYNEIDFQDNYIGDFIVMYPYEFSSKLSLRDNYYVNDSYNLDDDDSQLPLQIVTKTDENGYKIPAFNVIYGNQEQKYFNNINVSMDNPICTEQSLKAQYSIATYNNKTDENNKNAIVLGQDLYTIYSNNSYTCTVQMMGCAWIQPLMYFQLSSIPLFRGAYLIEKVKHHIEPGNMITEFVGVRMRKDVTNIMQNPYYFPVNNNIGVNDNNNIVNNQETLHSINMCGYKFYNIMENTNIEKFNINIFDMTLNEYSSFVKSEWTNTNIIGKFDVYNTTMIDFLTSVIMSNINKDDISNDNDNFEIAISLCATVLFNQYLNSGQNFITMVYSRSNYLTITELINNGIDYTYITSCKEIILDIFSNTPSKLIGKKSKYIDNGEEKFDIITTDILSSIDYYDKYQLLFNDKIKCKNSIIYFYSLNNKIYYKFNANNQINNYNTLYSSISKTLSLIDDISFELIKFNIVSSNELEIFYTKSMELDYYYKILDAIILTYYDYISSCILELNLLTQRKIIIKNSESNVNKKISIINYDGNLLSKESLNNLFYETLYKKFKKIDETNSKEFISTFTNFNCTIENSNEIISYVNDKFSKCQSEECTYENNTSQTEGYSWNGTSHSNNKLKPSIGKIKELDNELLGKNAYNAVINGTNYNTNGCDVKPKNKSCHRCAAWVRSAILKTINNNEIGNYPYSACVYERFLPSWGFEKIYESASHTLSSYKPINGDISVIAGKINNINDVDESSRHGHIQIYYNGCWYSDFECKTAWTYSDNRPFKIFRWKS